MSSFDPDAAGWPEPPKAVDENTKALYSAQLEVRKKRTDAEIARRQAEVDAEIASNAAYEEQMLTTAAASIDRSRSSAETVQKAASAIVTLYTGVLALAFSVNSRPLPSRGLIPAILLGLAIVCSTGYLAYLSEPGDTAGTKPTSMLREMARRRLVAFILWARAASLTRSYWLRASVLALGASLAFLPAPFVTIGKKSTSVPKAVNFTPWPTVPTNGASVLERIRYTAEVNEVAALRKQEAASAQSASTIVRDKSERWWWLAFAIALFAVLLGPKLVELVEKYEIVDRKARRRTP
jgi:hypothetical protein